MVTARQPEVFVRALEPAEAQRLVKITRMARDGVRLRRAGIVLASVQGRSAAEAAAMFAASVCRVAKTPPQQVGCPFTTWSLSKLVEHLAARSVLGGSTCPAQSSAVVDSRGPHPRRPWRCHRHRHSTSDAWPPAAQAPGVADRARRRITM